MYNLKIRLIISGLAFNDIIPLIKLKNYLNFNHISKFLVFYLVFIF